jgi:hypothetical protein
LRGVLPGSFHRRIGRALNGDQKCSDINNDQRENGPHDFLRDGMLRIAVTQPLLWMRAVLGIWTEGQ